MSNYRSDISQEEFEEIEQYLLGTLSESQKAEFELRLRSDVTLRNEVKLQRSLMTSVELGAFGNELKNLAQPAGKSRKLQTSYSWLYAAAVVGILITGFVGWMLLRDSDSPSKSDLFAAYFYPDPGLPVVMSSTDRYEFYDGMVSYKEGKYEEALALWRKLPTEQLQSDTVRYYQGVALLNLEKLDESAAFLEGVSENAQSEFYGKAIWYQALIQNKKGNSAEAIRLLEKIQSDPRAAQLLEELQKSP